MSPKLRPILAYLDALEGRADLCLLGAMLESAKFTVDDVHEHCRFAEAHYYRNKIASGPWYDFFVMGWRPGQSSVIHDHSGSSCALRIVQGTATELGFVPIEPGSNVVRMETLRTFHTGTQCMAQDEDVHQIVNRSLREDLVTIHIYSPPLKMSVYKEEKDLGEIKTDAELEAELALAGGYVGAGI
jgi:cysteine dioxygenase